MNNLHECYISVHTGCTIRESVAIETGVPEDDLIIYEVAVADVGPAGADLTVTWCRASHQGSSECGSY